MEENHVVIISGGRTEDAFAVRFLERHPYADIIAADSGLEVLYRNRIKPDMIIGDLDSVSPEIAAYYEKDESIPFRRLNPVKDDTDTEAAIRLAIEHGAERITLLGATGTRIDHMFANISLLQIGIRANVPITILDTHNRIRMTEKGLTIKKAEQYGRFVSLLPHHGDVTHLTLLGMKYPLTDYHMTSGNSLGISNEIIEEEAVISFETGLLLVIEAKD